MSLMRRYQLVLVTAFLCVLLTSAFWYAFATTPSSNIWISPGVYPGAPAYTVWREGSNYFAKDANGYVEFSGTNASQITQNCINTFTAWGGTVDLIGDLTFTHSVLVDNTMYPIRFTGNVWSTRITYTGSDYWLVSSGDNQKFHKIDNLQIKVGSGAKGCIHLQSGSFYWDIEQVTFQGTTGSGENNYGIVFNKTTSTGVYWNRVDSCRFYDLNISISVEGGANAQHFIDPIIRNPTSIGIQLLSGNDNEIIGGRIEGVHPCTGIYVNTSYNQFHGVSFELTDVSTYGYNFTANGNYNHVFGGRFNIAGTPVTSTGTDNLFFGDNYMWSRTGSYPSGMSAGQLCYRRDLNHTYLYNGTDWLQVDN